jgi:polyisoprenoid-binding protein YceI
MHFVMLTRGIQKSKAVSRSAYQVGRLLFLLVALFVAECATPGFAQDQIAHPVTILFSPANTVIRWTLVDVLHTVHGTFKLQQGVVHFNPQTGAADGMLVVDAKSGESGSSARDKKMHQNFLESERYPTITFVPNHVSGDFDLKGDHSVIVDGVFRLHGSDHPLQLHVQLHPEQEGIRADTQFVVPYVQWGIKDPSTFVLRVNKTVAINVEGTAKVAP